MDVLIRGQKPYWGVVCARSHTSPTLFVRFIEGQLMLTRRSRNWDRDMQRDVKVGDVIQFIWKSYPNLDGCIGVVDTYVIIPPDQQPSFLTASVRKTNGPSGQTVLVSCELRYEGKENNVAVFHNEHLGRVFDDNKKIHENALSTEGVYQCLISRVDDRCTNLHYWMIAHCQFYPENLLDGPHHGFAAKLPDREDPLIWPTDTISKRPLSIHKEAMSGFRDSNLGCFVDYWVIPGSRTIGRMRVASSQPPTKKIGDKYLIALECTFTGHKTRVTNIDVLSSRMYRWIEDRPGIAKKLKMKKKQSGYFWCYLDISSTNVSYLDWVIFDEYDEGREGPYITKGPPITCYRNEQTNRLTSWVDSAIDLQSTRADQNVVEVGGGLNDEKWFDDRHGRPSQDFYEVSSEVNGRQTDTWNDFPDVWDRAGKRMHGKHGDNYPRQNIRGKEPICETRETAYPTFDTAFDFHQSHSSPSDAGHSPFIQGLADDDTENMQHLASLVRELFQNDEIREVARRVNPNAYGDLVESLAFSK